LLEDLRASKLGGYTLVRENFKEIIFIPNLCDRFLSGENRLGDQLSLLELLHLHYLLLLLHRHHVEEDLVVLRYTRPHLLADQLLLDLLLFLDDGLVFLISVVDGIDVQGEVCRYFLGEHPLHLFLMICLQLVLVLS